MKTKKDKMIERRFCPRCKSENVQPLLGFAGFTGTFRCGDCNFTGQFPVKEIKIDNIRRNKR